MGHNLFFLHDYMVCTIAHQPELIRNPNVFVFAVPELALLVLLLSKMDCRCCCEIKRLFFPPLTLVVIIA